MRDVFNGFLYARPVFYSFDQWNRFTNALELAPLNARHIDSLFLDFCPARSLGGTPEQAMSAWAQAFDHSLSRLARTLTSNKIDIPLPKVFVKDWVVASRILALVKTLFRNCHAYVITLLT